MFDVNFSHLHYGHSAAIPRETHEMAVREENKCMMKSMKTDILKFLFHTR